MDWIILLRGKSHVDDILPSILISAYKLNAKIEISLLSDITKVKNNTKTVICYGFLFILCQPADIR